MFKKFNDNFMRATFPRPSETFPNFSLVKDNAVWNSKINKNSS